MVRTISTYMIATIAWLFPAFSFAASQGPRSPESFKDLVGIFLDIIALLVPLVFGLAFIVFIWGIMQAWIIGGASEENVTKGKNIALWGIIAFAVGSGVWGIVALLRSSLF